jgi:hypothetical protein
MHPRKIGDTAKQTSANTCCKSHMIHIANIPSTQQTMTKRASIAVCTPVEAFESACQSVPVAYAAAALGEPKLENQESVFDAAFPTH